MDEPTPPASAWWPALAGVVLCAALLLLDAVWGPERIISSTVVIAPFLTALRGTTRQTACVGALALAGCALSGTRNENFGSVEYLLRLAVVGAGASFAVLAARTRIRLDASRSRVALIAAVLLPASLPDIPGWASAALYRAAGEENLVGGDFYDAFRGGLTGGWSSSAT